MYNKVKIILSYILEKKKMSTNPTNGGAEIKEKNDNEFSKAFIYDATSKDENSLVQINDEISKNKFYGDIQFTKINVQNNQIVTALIEEQLVANNNEFTRYPSDYIHVQMCSHVYKYETLKKGDRFDFGGEEFGIHTIFNKYTGLIGEANTLYVGANRVPVLLLFSI
jgi:hypothetical protein